MNLFCFSDNLNFEHLVELKIIDTLFYCGIFMIMLWICTLSFEINGQICEWTDLEHALVVPFKLVKGFSFYHDWNSCVDFDRTWVQKEEYVGPRLLLDAQCLEIINYKSNLGVRFHNKELWILKTLCTLEEGWELVHIMAPEASSQQLILWFFHISLFYQNHPANHLVWIWRITLL